MHGLDGFGELDSAEENYKQIFRAEVRAVPTKSLARRLGLACCLCRRHGPESLQSIARR